MALMGFVHGHGGSHHAVGGHGHAGLGHGHAGASQGHAALGHGHAAPHAANEPGATSTLQAITHSGGSHIVHWAQSAGWMLISPIDLFGLAMGGGLVGMFLTPILGANLTILAAIVGAGVFEFGIIKPLMGFLFRAAAPASEGLEGMVSQTAIAQTTFDKSGKGVVHLVLDGQTVQVLGRLDDEEQKKGVRICKGDSVIILEVNPTSNICRVSRELTD